MILNFASCVFGLLCLSFVHGYREKGTVVETNDIPVQNRRSQGLFRKAFKEADLNIHPDDHDDASEPLFLTPLIKAGKIKQAQKLSKVRVGHRYGHSFSGFLTVNEKYNSNMFFWFFPARANVSNSPVVVWLQGGPGGSSLFGLFDEHGPFNVNADMNLVPRNYSWNNNHNVIYFDNPVGTGFSFTDHDAGYAINQADVGRDLYSAMTQFFLLFPDFQKNDLYITGESYAGKYVPALTYTIHKMNYNALVKMNLKGMAIGDGLCDPISMTDYGDFLYQIGLLDQLRRDEFKKQSSYAVKYIQQKQWRKAFLVFDNLLNGDTINGNSYFYNATGLRNYFNYLLQDEPKSDSYFEEYINKAKVRKEIHVGNLTFHAGTKVEQFLLDDIMKSVKPWIEEILDHYKVMFYNGQLDIIIASSLTDSFLKSLKWKYSQEFAKADRNIWRDGNTVAGYVKQVPSMSQVLIRNAGHMVPQDQPKWAYDMITAFTHDTSLV